MIPYYFLYMATKTLRTLNFSYTNNSNRGWMMHILVYIYQHVSTTLLHRIGRHKNLNKLISLQRFCYIVRIAYFENKTNLIWWIYATLKLTEIIHLNNKVCFKYIISNYINIVCANERILGIYEHSGSRYDILFSSKKIHAQEKLVTLIEHACSKM